MHDNNKQSTNMGERIWEGLALFASRDIAHALCVSGDKGMVTA